jgi:hypothetical protein
VVEALARQALRGDEVAPAELGAIDPELAGKPVDRPLDHEVRLRLAPAAVGAQRHLVGHHGACAHAGVRDLVDAREHHGGQPERAVAHGVHGRPHVADEIALDPGDRAVLAGGHAELHALLACMDGRQEGLQTILDPADRPAGFPGGKRDRRLLGVEMELGPEAPSYARNKHTDSVLGQPEHAGEQITGDMDDLGGGPER